MEFKTYHAREQNIGQPLGGMLKRLFPGKSWAEVKRIVTTRRVQLNGNLCVDETRRLRPGDIVRIAEESMDKPPDEQQIILRFQDEHMLVVEKPAGVTTLRHIEEKDWDEKRKNRQQTLDEMLQKIIDKHGISRMPGRGAGGGVKQPQERKKLAKQVQRGRARIKVRAVHRLDRDTSGLMVFALSPAAEQELVKGFSKHKHTRAYLAVVHGKIESPRTIETNFVRDRGDGLRGSLPQGQTRDDAKPAITHLKPVKTVGDYTLIECKLETGRTHQIRIHLAEIGHRICGETMYVRPLGGETLIDHSGAPRQALHAYRLGLAHPITNAPMNFEMKMPRDIQRWLKRLEDIHDTAGDAV